MLTKNIQPESFGPCLLIFTFRDYILSASENSITVWKTINQPPIDSGKTITEKKKNIAPWTWQQIQSLLGTDAQIQITGKYVLKSIHVQ